MLTYVRKFTYLTAAKNSNKGYLTYGKVNIKSEKSLLSKEFITQARLFYALSLDKVINGTLDVRSSTYNGYRWDEVMSAMSDVFLRGGDCVEDVNRSECHLRESPEVRIPTSHTIGRAIKELSHEDMEYKSSSGNVFRFNTNPRLNDLLMKLNMKMGLFKSGKNCQRGFRPCFRQDGKSRCDIFGALYISIIRHFFL